jgi:histidinol-phosphatase (PHP family)
MCGHAEGEMEKYIAVAKQRGLQELGFSDHIPMYFLPEKERDSSIAMREEDLPGYVQKIKDLQKTFYPWPIKIGIEADYIPGMETKLADILRQYDFDYVLGSIHFLDGWGFDNPANIDGYKKCDLWELYRQYFFTLGQAAVSGLFDVLAHPDLIKKFGFDPGRELDRSYREALQQISDSGVCVEINTAGLRVPKKEIYPSPEFLNLCFENKVPVSLGSDAHKPEQVGADFNLALELLRSIGYNQVVKFDRRNRNYCRI